MKEAASSCSSVEVATTPGYVAVERAQLADSELEGYQLGEAKVSLIFIDLEPGNGPRLHRHPYEEIFIVLEGQARFSLGSDILEVSAGKVLLVQPGVPHKFVNSGHARLRQIDVHASARFVTEWLEDEAGGPSWSGQCCLARASRPPSQRVTQAI
jgi:mannose-6-phosphate isomerase-like protein (cupin superfamily)